jgi:DNA-binding MarR family transcriptional regulator
MHAVAFTIKRAHLRTLDISGRCVRRFGITPARYDMLAAIAERAATVQSDLWRLFHVSRATVSRMVLALEELGLVRRWRSNCTRSIFVELTEKGRLLFHEAKRGCHRPMCLLFESLYPEVPSRLDRACRVSNLHGHFIMLALAFGDRSHFTYDYSHPEDVGCMAPLWKPRAGRQLGVSASPRNA